MIFAQVQTLAPEKSGVNVNQLDEGIVWLQTFGWSEIVEWWHAKFTSTHVSLDLSVVAASFLIALAVSWALQKTCKDRMWHWLLEVRSKLKAPDKVPVFPLMLSVVLWGAVLLTNGVQQSCPITRTVTLLVSAYAVTRLPTYFVRQSYWVKPVMVVVFLHHL